MIEIVVGTSQNWDPEEAIKEALSESLKKDEEKPKFILLFSTTHYKKNGGFKKILNTVYNSVPKNTPLLGGSVAGFMNKKGCFTRGISILICYSDEIEIDIGLSKNTKLLPKIAGKNCAKQIMKNYPDFPNKYFIFLVSSATVPNFPIINKKIVNLPGINLILSLFDPFSKILQIGPSRDETIFSEFSNSLKDSYGIGGGVCDNLELFDNALFLNNSINKNSVAAICINTKRELKINSSNGLRPTNKVFTITDISKSGYIINKINNEPPLKTYLDTMGWSEDILDERIYRKIFYYPIINENDEKKEPRMFGLIYGNKFIFPMKGKLGQSRIYQSTGKDIINSATNLIDGEPKNFGIGISCGTKLETLGKNSYIIHEELSKKLKEFLIIYTAGEFYKNKYHSSNYQTDTMLSG